MLDFKIKRIKTLDDTKRIFNFISNAFFMEGMRVGEEFPPLHELYEIMIKNLYKDRDLQFYGMLDKNIIGAIICSPMPYDQKCLSINIIYVKDSLRQNGFGNYLVAEAEMLARRKGYDRIRVIYHDNFHTFFEKQNYKLLLELAIPETLPFEDVLKLNNLEIEYSKLTKFNDINFVEYNVSSADKKIKHYISKNTPLVKSNFILEKKFSN